MVHSDKLRNGVLVVKSHTANVRCGERGRTRTYNQVIKSHLLYQLSYAPFRGKTLRGRLVLSQS
jgi:hypothetical protein